MTKFAALENAFTHAINAMFERVGEDGISHTAPNGQLYMTVRSCGLEVEGKACDRPAWFATPVAAIEALAEHIKALSTGRREAIYWRKYPAIEQQGGAYRARARVQFDPVSV